MCIMDTNKTISFILVVGLIIGASYIASISMQHAISPQLDYSQLQTQEQRNSASIQVTIIFAPFILFFGLMTYLTSRNN